MILFNSPVSTPLKEDLCLSTQYFLLITSNNCPKTSLPKLIKEKFPSIRLETLFSNPRHTDFILLFFFLLFTILPFMKAAEKFIESNFKRLPFIITDNNTICSPKRRENSWYIEDIPLGLLFSNNVVASPA